MDSLTGVRTGSALSNPSSSSANKKHHPMGGVFCWQRMRDSNPRKRSQSPVCYRYTNPLSGTFILYPKIRNCQYGIFDFLKIFPKLRLPGGFPRPGDAIVLGQYRIMEQKIRRMPQSPPSGVALVSRNLTGHVDAAGGGVGQGVGDAAAVADDVKAGI